MRWILLPIFPKVKAVLEWLEGDRTIENVTHFIDWCAPIVPVNKKNMAMCLSVKLKRFNLMVKQKQYMLPNIDNISAKLNKVTVF